ncbi:MAG: hypothetical protein K0S27_50 [Gammaproteobacteria bacterium]|jgi:hypothetical protein|nr:hypothetical protein [Gammaproteobacteria bacterium]
MKFAEPMQSVYTLLMTYPITHYLQQDSNALDKLLSKLSQLQQWNHQLKECLGENAILSEHCFIVNLAGSALIAIVDNPHWLTRFRLHIPTLLPKLRHYAGLENIEAICCKIHPHYTPASLVNRKPQQKLSPMSSALFLETADKIVDEKLRTILKKIAANCHSSSEPV